MELHYMPQGTEEWFDAHFGVPSASSFGRIVTATGKKSGQWNSYLAQKVDEIVNGMAYDTEGAAWLTYGKQYEDAARMLYEFERDNVETHSIGFITGKGSGCSPDMLVYDNGELGGLEIKCPKPTNHINYIRENRVPLEYQPQVQASMWITGLPWWDFLSFPATENMRPFLIRAYPDEDYFAALDKHVPLFLAEMWELTEKVKI